MTTIILNLIPDKPITTTVFIYCFDCGGDLEVAAGELPDSTGGIPVSPCKQCLKSAREEGELNAT